MSTSGAKEERAPYVPCPILDQRYAQRFIGPTPFASAKQPNVVFEPRFIVAARGDDGATKEKKEYFHYHMTYPSSLKPPSTPQQPLEDETTDKVPTELSKQALNQSQVPNPYWSMPPATMEPRPNHLEAQRKLPRDSFHPLLSELQAAENAKAAHFNPQCAYIACASRKGPPCDGHLQQPKTEVSVGYTAGEDAEEGLEEEGFVKAKVTKRQAKARGDTRTRVGRAYSADGCFHDPDVYSTKIIEFATTQQTTLTGIAAKALASAVHRDKPSFAIPANVLKQRELKVTPNSTASGTNANLHEGKGVHDAQATIVPPSPAFRRLSPEVQSAMMTRSRDTRHHVHELVRLRHGTVTPDEAKEDGEETSNTAKKREVDADPDEAELSEGDVDPEAAVGKFSSVGVWAMALHRKGPRQQGDELSELPKSHPLRGVVLNRRLRVLTPKLASVYNNHSNDAHFTTYLTGVGLRMEDGLAQTTPPSLSSFNDERVAFDQLGRDNSYYSNTQHRTCNSFAFPPNRFNLLIADKGEEVEEIFFPGQVWVPDKVLADISKFCPALKLLDLSHCTQLTKQTLQLILSKCKLISYLNISGCTNITGDVMTNIFENCHQLTVLAASGLNIDPRCSIAFSKLSYTRQLSVVDFSYCETLPDEALVELAQHCRALEMLDITGCRNVGDIGVASIGGCCSRLTLLKMKLCDQSKLTCHGISQISRAPRNLTTIDLAGCVQIDTKTLEEVVAHAPCLQHLSIAGCTLLNDQAVFAVTRYCKHLATLNLSSCRGVSLESCLDAIHELKELRRLVVSESSISTAEVVMLSSVRESCKIIRNQFRSQPPQKMRAFLPPEPKKKPAPKDGDKKKKK